MSGWNAAMAPESCRDTTALHDSQRRIKIAKLINVRLLPDARLINPTLCKQIWRNKNDQVTFAATSATIQHP